MENCAQTIEKFIIEINESINEKINGINFLELLKYKLIEKIDELEEDYLKNLEIKLSDNKILEKNLELNNRNLSYKIEYYDKSISEIKRKTEKDYLSLILAGLKSIKIFDFNDEKKSIFSNLYKNMGIVLGLNTVITTKISEKSVILSISIN